MKKYFLIPIVIFVVSLILTYSYLLGTKSAEKKKVSNIVAIPNPTTIIEIKDVNLTETIVKREVNSVLEKVLLTLSSGNIFCNSHYYTHVLQEDKLTAYVWAHCEEYVVENDNLKLLQSKSIPLKLSFEISGPTFTYEGMEMPSDGSGYNESVARIFPSEFRNEILTGFDISLLYPTPLQLAKKYFQN